MKEIIDLSIIIVSHNTKKLLEQCLSSIFESLKTTKIKYELIIVDNNSVDGSLTMLQKLPKTILIQNTSNFGFGFANNQGIKKSRGKTILLLNSDIVVLNSAIEKLYKFNLTLPQKVIIGGKLFNPDLTPQTSCGPEYNLPVVFTALFLKGDYLNITRYSPIKVKKVSWVMGACLMANRDAFINIGLFDESIFMYMEEVDFQYRAKKLGYSIFFYPEAHFIHYGSGSSQNREFPILNVFRGLIFFYKKHRPLYENIILRVLLLLKASLAIILFTLLNNKNDQKLYFKALKITLS